MSNGTAHGPLSDLHHPEHLDPLGRRSSPDRLFGRISMFMALGGSLATGSAHELPAVVITAPTGHALGTTDSASEGMVGASLIMNRALLRPAELLESIPGMLVTQHSSDGKANQYFLRGMNLDHGTDFATTINGGPLNLPSHGHGHGYSDMNLLIPELVSRIDYRKGPYFAADGDFSSAGSAHVIYRTRLEQPFASLSVGARGYLRTVAAASRELTPGITLLSAIEAMNNDGPWSTPQDMNKRNALLTLSSQGPKVGWSTSLSAYSAGWRATDQIPQRLIEAGSFQGRAIGRFDSLDPTTGGETRRISLSGRWQHTEPDELSVVQWYLLRYELSLFSNFTYSLDRDSDQFGQSDHRSAFGARAYRSWFSDLDGARPLQTTLGIQFRQDRARVGLYDTQARQIQEVIRDDDVRQSSLGAYGEVSVSWTPWVRTVSGVRADAIDARVVSHTPADQSGRAHDFLVSPKMSVILGPWHDSELFFNAGRGFHSNDARGMTIKTDPRSGLPVDRVPGLVSSMGKEVGIRSRIVPNLHSTLALWQLGFDSELVYVGDAGNTEAGRPSLRRGVEWSTQWTPNPHLLVDLSMAGTRARFTDEDPAGSHLPNAHRRVANMTASLRSWGSWSGSLNVRYIGAAPLIEDNSVRSQPSLTVNLRVNRQISPGLTLALDVLNLTQSRNNDISYFYRSRVAGEAVAGLEGIHVHPAEPRTLRLTAMLQF